MFRKSLLFLLLFSSNLIPQVQSINSSDQVYNFLQILSIKKIITGYSDAILPLTQEQILYLLTEANQSAKELTTTETALLNKFLNRYNPEIEKIVLTSSPGDIFIESEKKFYHYWDSSLYFSADPDVSFGYYIDLQRKSGSSLMNLGGTVQGSYGGWFGFSASASNGVVIGNRDAVINDKVIEQSFTFNQTGHNFFDATSGHLNLQYGILKLQLGRELILAGTGYADRLLISGNAPDFDFVRLGLSYKKVRYDFIHGWLVQKPVWNFIDPLSGWIPEKESKYIALSRIGFSFSPSFDVGLAQVIIYSNRPLEAAYLNPFLFWESAQRSLNDLDNSLLNIDMKWRPAKNLEMFASVIFDDIHFGRLVDRGWNIVDNRLAFQSGILYIPGFIRDLQLSYEYTQIRPYTFSHPGIGESLSYTNNGYFIGIPLQPNSIKNTLLMNYPLSEELSCRLTIARIDHGRNTYDDDGNLIKNFGGDIFEYFRLNDDDNVYLLGGERAVYYESGVNIVWEFIRNFYAQFTLNYRDAFSQMIPEKNFFFSTGLSVRFF